MNRFIAAAFLLLFGIAAPAVAAPIHVWEKQELTGILTLPEFPGDTDWGLRLIYKGPAASGKRR